MRTISQFLVLLLLAIPTALAAQLSTADLNARVSAAQADDADARVRIQGAAAARLLGNTRVAGELAENAIQFLNGAQNALATETVLQAMASGEGANGMLRAFRAARERINMPPQQIAAIVNNFPTLLTGGEFDEMILSFSEDHHDPAYRCACLAQKAWVHRVAGRADESTKLWAQLAEAQESNPPPADNPQAQGQYARNLARAGRTAEARRTLEAAMAMSVTDEQRPGVQRRWAQAYAELGDVEGAVAQLEPLIESSTLVTVNSLSTRYSWKPVRDHPAFQAMLDRHR
jgi:tetratricopeptide (TPR) repeat protein